MAADPATSASLPYPALAAPTRVRYGVLAFLCTLSFILYLDRICIAQAVPSIQAELAINDRWMSYILGAFTVAYGLFEVPTGRWGDRYGSRGVLTRIVIWWSAFTALTGAATGPLMLIVVRFLFGAGEAGALPNSCRVVARWFPPGRRGPAQGIVVTSAQLGGALAPVWAAYLIELLGWRLTFWIFGLLGVYWAVVFYLWYRDDPAEHPAANEAERRLITGSADWTPLAGRHPPVPWQRVLSSANVWLMGAIMACGAFVAYLYFSWYPKYLQEARGVSSIQSGWFTSLVLGGGALGGVLGGFLSDRLVRWTGNRRWSRKGTGFGAFSIAALALFVSIYCEDPLTAVWLTTLACFCAQVQLASWWAVVTEISGPHVGVLFGLMNSLGVPGAVGSQLFLGHLVQGLKEAGYSGRDCWDPGFYFLAAALGIGAVCWLRVDTDRTLAESAATLPLDPGDPSRPASRSIMAD
jgi:MFS family permease